MKPLTVEYLTVPEYRLDLARCQNDMGFLHFTLGEMKDAEDALTAALAIRKQAVTEFPNVPENRNDLAGTCVNLANLFLKQRDFRSAKSHLEEAAPHHAAALAAKPKHPIYRQFYRNNLSLLTFANAGLSDQTAAKGTALTVRNLGWDLVGDTYDAACLLSQCIQIIQKNDAATKEARNAEAAFYGDEAMKLLRDAVAKGWKNADHMKKDTDLVPLREREDFQNLLADLEQRQKNK